MASAAPEAGPPKQEPPAEDGADARCSDEAFQAALAALATARSAGAPDRSRRRSTRPSSCARLIVGMSEAFATVYIDPQIGELVPFALLLLILFTRPWGLFGRPQGALRV